MSETFSAYLKHPSISRSRVLNYTGTLAGAKRAAMKEFGDEQNDYRIIIEDVAGNVVAARRVVGGYGWFNYDA